MPFFERKAAQAWVVGKLLKTLIFQGRASGGIGRRAGFRMSNSRFMMFI